MAYIDFPDTYQGMMDRKEFWLSDDGISLIAGWRREGVGLEQIAFEYIGVSDRTLSKWRQQSPALRDAIRCTDDTVNAMVEESLLKRALGYDYEEEVYELVEGEMRHVRTVRKHMPPDTKACLSWLYSRRSDRWRAVQEPRDSRDEDIIDVKNVLVSIAGAAEQAALPEASDI